MTNDRNGAAGRRMARSSLALSLILLFLVPAGPAFATEKPQITDAPRKLIDDTAQQIVAILSNKDEPTEKRVAQIEEIAYKIFDFTTMSKLVLARNWRKLSDEKKAEFVREFREHLSRTYGTRLDRFDQERVDVTGAKVEPRDDVSITTMIVGGQFDGAIISYRMRNRKDRWRIIDVVIEGVSLVSNYRSQFAQVLNNGSIDDLLAKLRDKNFVVDDGVEDKAKAKDAS
jgi:phospholipid transport system substrate-binding protein